jgi:hypothetical protein
VPNVLYSGFEFADQRSIGTVAAPIPAVCMADGELSGNPGGRCTDSQGHSSIWTGFNYVEGGFMSIVNDPANCRNGSSFCFRVQEPAGSTTRNGLSNQAWTGYSTIGGNTFVQILPSTPTNAYFRAYFKFPVGFTENAACTGGKLMYFRAFGDGTSGQSPTTILQSTNPWNGGTTVNIQHAHVGFSPGGAQNYPCNVGSCFLPFDGQYHEVEVHIDTPGQHTRMWIDGTLRLDLATPLDPLFNVKGYGVGHYTTIGQNPAVDCTQSVTRNFWIDDVAMSTQRMGAGGSPPTPNAPTNLRLMTEWMRRIWAALVTGMVA